MEKEQYKHAELELIKFQTEDVILSSNPLEEEDELPIRG